MGVCITRQRTAFGALMLALWMGLAASASIRDLPLRVKNADLAASHGGSHGQPASVSSMQLRQPQACPLYCHSPRHALTATHAGLRSFARSADTLARGGRQLLQDGGALTTGAPAGVPRRPQA